MSFLKMGKVNDFDTFNIMNKHAFCFQKRAPLLRHFFKTKYLLRDGEQLIFYNHPPGNNKNIMVHGAVVKM